MIKIYTLGDFDINIQDKPILDSANYSYRLIKLFKYFLTFRNRKLVPEKIVGDLWHEEDFIDPKRTLRTQISRLRRGIGNGSEKDTFFNISFSYGYYIFTLDEKCV